MLIEDHEAVYQPPVSEHPDYPTGAAPAGNTSGAGSEDFGLPSIDSTPLLVDGTDLPPAPQQQSSGSSASFAAWLDGLYNGLSVVAPALAAAGVSSSAQLAELAYLGDATLEDFIASASLSSSMSPLTSAVAARDPNVAAQLTPFRQVILKNGVRSRFGTTVGTAV